MAALDDFPQDVSSCCFQLRYATDFASFPCLIPDTLDFHGWITFAGNAVQILYTAFQTRDSNSVDSFQARVLSPVFISIISLFVAFQLVIFSSLRPACCAAGTAVIAHDLVQKESGQTHCLALTIPLPIVKRGSGIPELSGCDFKALSWEL